MKGVIDLRLHSIWSFFQSVTLQRKNDVTLTFITSMREQKQTRGYIEPENKSLSPAKVTKDVTEGYESNKAAQQWKANPDIRISGDLGSMKTDKTGFWLKEKGQSIRQSAKLPRNYRERFSIVPLLYIQIKPNWYLSI